jgi:sialate O-acetylesterase
VLYNTRIHPLAPFAIRGVIWHQGEAGPGGPYGDRLVAMVRQWRTLFGQDFDFIWGTLSRSTTVAPPLEPIRSSFYRSGTNRSIRGAISGFGDDKRVAMVELYDLGNEETHFLQKNEMGRRYALAALALSHGQPVLYSGPRMVETNIQGDRATVRFDLVGEGLVFRPSINGISGVYLRAKDGTARWGNVKIIDKSTMEVSHPDIKAIETIAYAEANNPHETLFNNEGFPASPFLVNPTNTKDPAAKFQLVAFDDKPKDVQFQIAHVRRDGYVLQLKPDNRGKPGPATLLAYIPSEWKGYEVEIGAKPVSVKETKQDGQTFVSFQADVDLKWIIVAEKGKAESFRKVNRF